MCIVTTVGKNISRIRLSRGWTQEVLAELAGVHKNNIGQVERGEYITGIVNLEKIAKGLEVPIYILLEEKGEKHETPTENFHEKSS